MRDDQAIDDEELAYALAVFVEELDRQHPWRRDAACREHPDLFLRDADESAAAEVCARCHVAEACDEYATGECVDVGVWAGSRRDREPPIPAYACAHCGSSFHRAQRPGRPAPKYCSRKCFGLANRTSTRPRHPEPTRRRRSATRPPCAACGAPTAPDDRVTELGHRLCAACDVPPEPTDCPTCTRDRERWGGRFTCRECRQLAPV